MATTTADRPRPPFLAAILLASILVGVANAEDAPSADDVLSAVAQGDADAQWQLGDAYHYGRDVPQDDAEAVRWYRAAAEQGNAEGQWRLGNAYYFGRGVAQDHAEAARWYRAAAEQGNAESQWRLGTLYANGRGVPLDFVAAYAWLNLAAAQGHEEGADSRDGLVESMTAEQVAEAQRMARELWGRIEGDSPAAP